MSTGNIRFPDGRLAPPIGQGSWHLGQGRRSANSEEEAMRAGIDLGLNLIDTAEMYGEGRSERHIGSAIAGRRSDVFLVSKVLPHNADRRGIPKACAASLARLGTDHLDLYLLHWRDARTDLAEIVDAFEALRDAGKIRAWGVSNFDVDDMEDLAAVPGGENCATNQVLYNLGSRGIEFALLPWCAERGIPVMAYTPLGGSRLLRDSALARIAARHGCATSAVALAWVARSGHVIAIPEAGNPAHIAENAGALALELTPDDLLTIDATFPPPHRKAPLDII